jgi:hypothetical protein
MEPKTFFPSQKKNLITQIIPLMRDTATDRLSLTSLMSAGGDAFVTDKWSSNLPQDEEP